MPAPKIALELIDRFDRNLDAYRSGQYKETPLRRDFIDPFFKALGWDIDNEQGHAEAYREVVHEDTIRVGGAHKAPDYSFRVGGTRKFFLEAYQLLLDWHRNWYVDQLNRRGTMHRAQKKEQPIYQAGENEYRLTTAERKRILLNNIYGVDIDPQAVEVTKLSLLLKVLEEESAETINRQLKLLHERALPDLASNIKCGNSLIGPDFYEGQQISLLDEEERYRINVFDWEAEFPEIFNCQNKQTAKDAKGKKKEAGFDAVIGNPPYGALVDQNQADYYRQEYEVGNATIDSYALFIEKASSLLHPNGILGMIVQSGWVSAPSMRQLRDVFSDRFKPIAFATMPYDVFGAYVDTIIVIAERLREGETLRTLKTAPVALTVFPVRFKIRSIDDFGDYSKSADSVDWINDEHNEFLVALSGEECAILNKINRIGVIFSDVADIQRGVTPFNVKAEPPSVNPAPAFSGTIRRYILSQEEPSFIQYDKTLAEYKPPRYFEGPRLLLRELISRQFQLQAVSTNENFVTNKSIQSILLTNQSYDIRYLLGLLNSRLLSWYFLSIHSVGRRDDFPKIVLKQTRELPFRVIHFSDRSDKTRHDKMVELVERMLALHQQLASARTEHEQTALQRQVGATDRQIDKLVYELYGLGEEEIGIVEGKR